MKSRHKLKLLNLYYHNAYSHKNCQGGDTPLKATSHKVIWSFNCVVLWGDMTNQIHYTSICRIPIGNKLGKVVTDHERLPILSHMISDGSCDMFTKKYISNFTKFMASKLGRVLISGRRFRTQTSKSPPTSCFKL